MIMLTKHQNRPYNIIWHCVYCITKKKGGTNGT